MDEEERAMRNIVKSYSEYLDEEEMLKRREIVYSKSVYPPWFKDEKFINHLKEHDVKILKKEDLIKINPDVKEILEENGIEGIYFEAKENESDKDRK